ncbi:MAG: glycoside hydrolase family 15 protein [Actinomycetota bacterium]|nr:glycoside hydrolase family 15 protein [Actinomycetota bacterium]
MSLALEEYALLGDAHTAALVSRGGSVDWLCLPRFDSPACFAALLGDEHHGRWLLAPAGEPRETRRRYRPGTLVLETDYRTDEGEVRVVDHMPPRGERPHLVRIAEGLRGRVQIRMELVIRFGYGHTVPWVRDVDGALVAIGGPDGLMLRTPVAASGERLTTVAEFSLAEGERVPFVLTWFRSHERPPRALDPERALVDTERWWRDWSDRCAYADRFEDAVVGSLVVLKALTYAPTGGIVAAPTTSLPENVGGVRNWDYRYCWIRDATFTLDALLTAGYTAEARAWRDWLLRATAGDAGQLQVVYGPAGERELAEREVPWLPGYRASRPVRVGNAASDQIQLDVFGELMDSMHQARARGLEPDEFGWDLQAHVLDHLESRWREPDAGMWEMRTAPRHFTHSKVMAWAAFDRAVAAVERFGLEGPIERWKRARAEIHDQVCREGYDVDRGAFVQSYGAKELDASLLLMPLVGFLPVHDERVRGTIDAIRDELSVDGFVRRYRIGAGKDVEGAGGHEGAFLACTFWLVEDLALLGRDEEARAAFERLLAIRSDLGLLAEEYDVTERRLVGNFPQAFSHVALVNAAYALSPAIASGHERRRAGEGPSRSAGR